MVLLGEKVTSQAPDLLMMAGAGVVKYAEERVLAATPVGNGTLLSAGVKGAISIGAHHFGKGNKYADMVALGFMVDAVEDGLTALLGGTGIGNMFGSIGGANASASTW